MGESVRSLSYDSGSAAQSRCWDIEQLRIGRKRIAVRVHRSVRYGRHADRFIFSSLSFSYQTIFNILFLKAAFLQIPGRMGVMARPTSGRMKTSQESTLFLQLRRLTLA